jgi:adenylate kinase family enzyme
MERILIIGCGGSGKSTLARQLGEKLNLPVVHLDQLWWLPGWVERDRESFDALLAQQLQKPQWIMDGNFTRTMSERLRYCDAVIHLDYSRLSCVLGVMKRIVTTYGTVRPDMGEGCPERFDLDFLKWVWNFNAHSRPEILKVLADYPDVPVYTFKNRRQLKRFLKSL